MDKFLKKAAAWVANFIKKQLEERKEKNEDQKEFFQQFVTGLVHFFHADGDGLAMNFLKPIQEDLLGSF